MPPAALAASPELAALARRAPAPRPEAAGIDAVLLAVAQMPPSTPLGAVAARGALVSLGSAPVARADPIALVAGRDDVLLGGRVDDLSVADADAFIDRLNAHFADDGLVFVAPRPDTWFVHLGSLAPPHTTPLAQVRGAIHMHLPRGEHAGQWKRWMSEMQMLLHDDPRNAERERAGLPAVTGIWIADAGIAPTAHDDASMQWFAPAGRAGDVARGLAPQDPASVPVPPDDFARMSPAGNAVVILPALRTTAALDTAVTAWLAPALLALDRGMLDALTVVADDGRGAFVWTPRAASRWTRWRAWSPTPRFVPPTTPEPH